MNWKEYLEQSKRLFEEAKAILNDKDATAEDMQRVEPLMEEAKAKKSKAADLKAIDAAGREIVAELDATGDTDPEGDGSKQKREDPTEFKEWGEYLYSVWKAEHPKIGGPPDPRLQFFKDEEEGGHDKKQMVESVGASGGFLVPVEFRPQLQAVMGEMSIVRNRATIIRMARRQLSLPVLDQTGTTAGRPHWFGGMQFYWAEEATEKTITEAQFRQVKLTAHKLIGYTRASDELVDDSAISLGDFLAGPLGFAGGIAWMEDFAFINGSGAGQPLGVLNAGATLTVPRAADGEVGYGDIAGMIENFMPTGTGMWVYTQSMLSELIQLSGPAGNPSYVWQPSARDGVPDTLFGMPAVRSEKVPQLGVQGDIGLYDWRFYLIGDRQATTIESTQFDQWRYDQTSWRAVHRVDGQPWLSTPLTYQDGVTQISPFVILGDKVT